MSEVQLRFSGLSPQNESGSCTISFEKPEMKLAELLAIIRDRLPVGSVVFVAVNGSKATQDTVVRDGDRIEIFPAVTGG